MNKYLYLIFSLLCFSFSIEAQENSLRLFKEVLLRDEENFTAQDIEAIKLSSQHTSKNGEITYAYFQQYINEEPILNALGSVVLKNGKIISYHQKFVSQINKKLTNSSIKISPYEALEIATENLNIEYRGNIELIIDDKKKQYFKAPLISQAEIPIEKVYVATEENLKIGFKLIVKTKNHWWSIVIDGSSQNIIWKNDWVTSCNFDLCDTNTNESILEKRVSSNSAPNASYKVYPIPTESPNHGNRILVNSPENLNASPFGWHDDNGIDGEEYTDTRGNNVWAYENRNGDNSLGEFADAQNALVFDFSLDLNQDPIAYADAATVNLFYWNNLMHDVWYEYGFDEASGNFQAINYGGTSQPNSDQVLARAQDGSNFGPGNNATFGTPPDGESGVMRMFTWGSEDFPILLNISSPPSLAGNYEALQAGFAADIPSSGIQTELVLIEESNSFTSDPYDACEVISNTNELNGNIAVIRRGTCSFLTKIQKAQNAGAIGVIIVNNVGSDIIYMQSNTSANITIPAIMISQADGTSLINQLISGENVNGSLANIGPFQKDGDFDSGIIAHEYGHGISNRLTGGASNSDCLMSCVDYDEEGNCIQKTEQMGEGWSDYFALVMTMKESDQPEDPRGIATYVTNQPTNGTGIRNAPYSTDFSVNDFTYGDTNDTSQLSAPHGVGFVWATMLWDLTWAFIDEYGFDADIYNGTGGNNKVMQLVIDGLKLQFCNPGFIDGRDAILQADVLEDNGDNQCLIWSVFAKRGLGFSATQGSSFSRTDQIEAFDLPPTSVLSCDLNTSDSNGREFKIYPNPVDDILYIEHGKQEFADISIFDINGRLIYSEKETKIQQKSIDVSSFEAGIYLVEINSNSTKETFKLIVK
ncbi:T9SS-dependent M36 family metallopeptidase [Mesonia maritima]|uniref:Secreted protein (Por secretion system target) n=1 Tax=Mesonia maritima TaxID=1793873 RepID=A0ABU1K345_9FLAO|nr:T9SS-dependent M36 family metallopeptidase [Mesonia maritima]MDR6300030.1 hypothetical protein [Mesonia maritima]